MEKDTEQVGELKYSKMKSQGKLKKKNSSPPNILVQAKQAKK